MSQVVQVRFEGSGEKTFAYQWEWAPTREPLNIGDRVLVPSNWRTPVPSWGTVAGFGAGGYFGPLAKILERGSV